jgi:two-component system cell cycle sensor histidine kinase/response regulator CckA
MQVRLSTTFSQYWRYTGVPFIGQAGDLLYVGWTFTFWMGVRAYGGKTTFNQGWLILPALVIAWTLVAYGLDIPRFWRILPRHFTGAAFLGWAGLHLWHLSREERNWGLTVLSILFLLYGLNTGIFPFTNHTWYGPYGFIIASGLSLSIGMGLMLTSLLEERQRLVSEMKSRQLAEEASRRSLILIETLLANSPAGVSIYEGNAGNCVLANQAMADMAGGSIDGLRSQNFRALDSWRRAGLDVLAESTLSYNHTQHREISIETTFGKNLSLDCFLSRFDMEGIPHLMVIVSDITERKHVEEERMHLESQLRQSRNMEAIGTLAGGVAHDFNNILTTIIGYSSLLQAGMDGSNPKRIYLDQILAASQKAANLTQSLLAFSRKQAIELKPHKVNEIVMGVEKLLMRLLTEDITFNVMFGDSDATIMADVTQIEQVLMNLATNARDAMPKGGVLVIETKEVQLDDEFIKIHGHGEPGSYAVITVTDTGCGMDEKTIEKVFEPFFTTKEVGRGTGLGLSTVYGIIKQHNGLINVYSEPGKGTVFRIYLPTVKAQHREITQAPRFVRGGTETILVAEDDNELRGLIKEVLASQRYAVIETVDGENAIQKFAEHTDSIHLVILDVVMPKKSGKDAYEEMKRIRPNTKALFASGYTGDVVFDKGIQDDTVHFISKPLSPNELLIKVREVLDK